MFLFRPGNARLQAVRVSQANCEHNYAEVGASEVGRPVGFTLDHNRICLGQGAEVFEAACTALAAWRMFPPSWTSIYPHDCPQTPGTVVIMLARALGLWWPNALRVVYRIDEVLPLRRVGFAYGTLPAHVECGEERFLIEQDAHGQVWYDVRAFSRPRHPLVRLAFPLARRLQLRFVRDSQQSMQRAVSDIVARQALGVQSN
jgi:uncharacterized protein (UPF0548 family)